VTSGELLLARGSTDSKGRFSFSLQRASLKEIRVTVDAGMGHHAFQILHLEPVAEPVVSPSAAVQEGDCEKASDHLLLSSEMMREIVRGELEPLKNMLLSLRREQEKAGITEILGGIGYIFGIVGICMWYRGGRRSG
jgi:nickel transport protein